MKALLITFGLTLASVASIAGAQSSTRLQLDPGSTLSFTGTSTLHGFTCKTDKMEAFIDVDPSFRLKQLTEVSHPIVRTRVVIPVKSIKCGEGKMDSNMYDALKANENPTIEYVLDSYEAVGGSTTATAFAAVTSGKLTIAGKQVPMKMNIKAGKDENGNATATGTYALKMTDYGVKPPKLMFGAIRVGNEVTVTFNLKASSRSVAAVTQGTPAER